MEGQGASVTVPRQAGERRGRLARPKYHCDEYRCRCGSIDILCSDFQKDLGSLHIMCKGVQSKIQSWQTVQLCLNPPRPSPILSLRGQLPGDFCDKIL